MATLLITGANRGIGLEFTRQYLANGDIVYACARDIQCEALNELKANYPDQLNLQALDVTDPEQIATAAKTIDVPIDVLINNAGIYRGQDTSGFDYAREAWHESFEANTMSPFYVTIAFLPHLKKGTLKKVGVLTSKMGSMDDNGSGGSYIYRASKAAANAVSKSLAIDLAGDDISVVILHPGWVKTDMTNNSGLIDTTTSVLGMRSVLESLDLSSSGQFIAYDGKQIAW